MECKAINPHCKHDLRFFNAETDMEYAVCYSKAEAEMEARRRGATHGKPFCTIQLKLTNYHDGANDYWIAVAQERAKKISEQGFYVL